jgi:hypothetical protein
MAISILKNESIRESTAIVIARKVWNELGSSDIRDALKVGRLTHNLQDIESLIRMMKT